MARAMRLTGLFVLLSPAGAWLDWLWGSDPSPLSFDLRNAPELVEDRRLFPDAYKSEMAFGTYRPGVYFGIKGRHAAGLVDLYSLLSGYG